MPILINYIRDTSLFILQEMNDTSVLSEVRRAINVSFNYPYQYVNLQFSKEREIKGQNFNRIDSLIMLHSSNIY